MLHPTSFYECNQPIRFCKIFAIQISKLLAFILKIAQEEPCSFILSMAEILVFKPNVQGKNYQKSLNAASELNSFGAMNYFKKHWILDEYILDILRAYIIAERTVKLMVELLQNFKTVKT